MNKEQRQKLNEALASGERTAQFKALQDMRKRGDSTLVPTFLLAFAQTDDDELRSEFCHVLYDFKDVDAMNAVLDHLGDPALATIRPNMVAAVWQSGLDMRHRLPELVEVALSGDYMECLEVLTAIENMDPPTDVAMVEALNQRMHSVMADDVNEKEDLLLSIIEVFAKWKA
jgi:hypothetical protein